MTPFDVIGFSVRTTNANPEPIHALWGRVFSEPSFRGKKLYGVYTDYESDHTGAYTLVVGPEAAPAAKAPEGMKRVSVPRASYRVFTAEGEMPRALIDTWGRVWSSGAPRAFTTDFELHDPSTPTRVEIHVAVK